MPSWRGLILGDKIFGGSGVLPQLGHLARDLCTMKHGDGGHTPEMEVNANAFAAVFLMPKESVASNVRQWTGENAGACALLILENEGF